MRLSLLFFTVMAIVVGILRRPDISSNRRPRAGRNRLLAVKARPSGGCKRDIAAKNPSRKGQNEKDFAPTQPVDRTPKKLHRESDGLGDVMEADVTLYTSSPDLLVEHVLANVPKATRLWHKLVFGTAEARFQPLVERFCQQRSVSDPEKSVRYGYIMPMLAHFPQVLEYYLNRLDRAHNPWRTGLLADDQTLREVIAAVQNNPPHVEALTTKLQSIAEDPTESTEVREACHETLRWIQRESYPDRVLSTGNSLP